MQYVTPGTLINSGCAVCLDSDCVGRIRTACNGRVIATCGPAPSTAAPYAGEGGETPVDHAGALDNDPQPHSSLPQQHLPGHASHLNSQQHGQYPVSFAVRIWLTLPGMRCAVTLLLLVMPMVGVMVIFLLQPRSRALDRPSISTRAPLDRAIANRSPSSDLRHCSSLARRY